MNRLEAQKLERPGPGAAEWQRQLGTRDLWLLWQLADSAFPIGGFGHSAGLEAAVQLGEVTGRGSLEGFLDATLRQCATATLPIVAAAHAEPGRLAELDEFSDAWLSNHVANRASRLQGRAFWMAMSRGFQIAHGPAPLPGHLAPVFGSLLAQHGVTQADTGRLFVFQLLRGIMSAAIRLGVIGPLEAQSVQHGFSELAERVALAGMTRGLDQLAQTSPLLDLWQGTQDRLYSRLFQS